MGSRDVDVKSPDGLASAPARRTPSEADGPSAAAIASASPQISPAVARAIEHVLRQPSDHPRAAVLDFSEHSGTPR